MKQVRVNVSTLVNASKIRREKRDGRDVIVVPSATLPDDVVMNKIRYPAPIIAESFKSLEGRPAPLGHPTVNGKYVSASSPDGIIRGFIGAHNENVRRENGRVFLDKVIDVQFANQSEGGKAVLAAIEAQQPIHTSTGLLATLKTLANDADASFEVESMILDHDCFLLDTPGAATPEQGVGIFVNAAGQKSEVINSTLEDDIDRDMEWQIDALLRSVERKKQLPLLERMKMSIMQLIQGDPTPDNTEGDALTANGDTMDKAQFDALSAKVDALVEAGTGLTEAKVAEIVGNALKPIADDIAARAKVETDKAEAERLDLVTKVVANGLLTEDVAKDATTPVLNALLSKGPAPAFRVNSAFQPNNTAERKPLALKGE
jgi:hypothetical protein